LKKKPKGKKERTDGLRMLKKSSAEEKSSGKKDGSEEKGSREKSGA
jgi:hypothetical protein